MLSLNAGAQTLPVAANGTFTFPTALASGSSYAVTVQTQPASPTQTCAVSNGSGTVVAKHHQHCRQLHDQHLHRWRHVSGLAGTGLVLSLNAGAQTLPLSQPMALLRFLHCAGSGASYAVTVQTQPPALFSPASSPTAPGPSAVPTSLVSALPAARHNEQFR